MHQKQKSAHLNIQKLLYKSQNLTLYAHYNINKNNNNESKHINIQDTITLTSKLKLNKISNITYGIQLKNIKGLGLIDKFCDNFQKFMLYIQQPGNIVANVQQKQEKQGKNVVIVTVLGHNSMFYQQQIVLANIELVEIQSHFRGEEAIQQIISRCAQDKSLQLEEIKDYIETLALSYQQILNSANYKKFIEKKQDQNNIQIKQIRQSLSQQISILIQKQNNTIRDEIKEIELSNMSILQNYSKTIKQLQLQIFQMKQIHKNMLPPNIDPSFEQHKQQLNQICKNIQKQQTENFSLKFQSIQKQNKQINDGVMRVQQKLMVFSKEIDGRMSKFYEIMQEIRKQSQMSTLQKWINPKCYKIISTKFNNSFTVQSQDINVIYAKKNIRKMNKFKVIFDRIGQKSAVVGIIDNNYIDIKDISKLPNRIRYLNTGQCRIGTLDQQKQQGFKIKQKIQVRVNILQGICEWWVNDKLSTFLKSELIKDQSISWVSYIGISKGDYVRIAQ